ncbi:MAG: histidine--tRNA ligase [Chloroflexi bacterium RBG_16_50_9]|nr:MAG: histidine--tRNA ligase [Chloroflexi bacterium RBG_16_50_9]
MYQAIRGTSDILPQEQAYWRYVEKKAVDICQLYGYQRIDSPTFEETGLFTRSVGQGTDIVEKEMYTFTDKGDNSITLRPEGTAPVCRAYLEHGMHNLPQPVKLYYLASIFRYERPQAGRLREHHQFGCEAIGDDDPALDAEVINMAWQFSRSLDLQNLSLQLNSIGCKKCRPAYLAILQNYYAGKPEGLCHDCNLRRSRNPLRLLDCKQPSCQQAASAAPRSVDHLCPDCQAHFSRLKAHLELLGIPFAVNHRLVRGLDYYTRTVFEIQPGEGGAQSTIGGGGRYDDLIEELGGKPAPAIGFAAGIERIILNLKKQDIPIPALPGPHVFIAYMGEEARSESIKLAARLRQAGIGTVAATGAKSLKAQMRQANSLGVRHAVIIGEEELKTGVATVRDMVNARQKTVPIHDLPALLK